MSQSAEFLQNLFGCIGFDFEFHTDIFKAISDTIIYTKKAAQIKVTFKSGLYRIDFDSFGGSMIHKAGCQAACQCREREFHRIGAMVLAQENRRLILFDNKRFVSIMGLACTEELIDSGTVMSAVFEI